MSILSFLSNSQAGAQWCSREHCIQRASTVSFRGDLILLDGVLKFMHGVESFESVGF